MPEGDDAGPLSGVVGRRGSDAGFAVGGGTVLAADRRKEGGAAGTG
jgi:hypothetical protein